MGDVHFVSNVGFWIGTGTASADRKLSGRMRNVAWSEEFEEHDVTVMGSINRLRAIGLGEASIEAELMMSYSSADVEENVDKLIDTLRDISATGKKFLVRLRPVDGARNATNPEYSMLAIMSKRNIIDGEVGTPSMTPITFLSAGDITRATATT